MDRKHLKLVPVDELKVPKDGHILVQDAYWPLLDGKAIFYKNGKSLFPQYNHNESLSMLVAKRLYPEAVVTHIPEAYVWEGN